MVGGALYGGLEGGWKGALIGGAIGGITGWGMGLGVGAWGPGFGWTMAAVGAGVAVGTGGWEGLGYYAGGFVGSLCGAAVGNGINSVLSQDTNHAKLSDLRDNTKTSRAQSSLSVDGGKRESRLIKDNIVRQELREAHGRAKIGTPDYHEEGGYILRTPDSRTLIEQLPPGGKGEIDFKAYESGFIGRTKIVGTYHIQPRGNGPSGQDLAAFLNYPNTFGEESFIVGPQQTYFYYREDGKTYLIGNTKTILYGEN